MSKKEKLIARLKDYIRMHKPHPRKILKTYQVQNHISDLKERDLI